jgi:kynureninase
VSFQFENGYAAMQACIARDLVGDFRAPDIMRFGFTPLFIDASDVDQAVAIIADVMQNRLWDDPVYQQRAPVT